MQRLASCCCGQLQLTCTGDPIRISVCHCHACQQRTGSAFGVQARFPAANVTVRGEATTYVRTGDDGYRISFRFCPTCGSTVYYTADYLDGAIAISVGSFADNTFPPPRVEVYTHRRHPWLSLAGTKQED